MSRMPAGDVLLRGVHEEGREHPWQRVSPGAGDGESRAGGRGRRKGGGERREEGGGGGRGGGGELISWWVVN